MFRITVLLSGKHGRGSNMAALHAACESGQIPNAAVTHVIGTHPDSPALARARNELGITSIAITSRNEQFDSDLLNALEQSDPDLICLAGYMRMIPEVVLIRLANKIVNIHPALLPSFGGKGMYGAKIHEAVLDHGCKVTGCTVHFIDKEFDTGPIILQKCVPVEEGDTPEMLAQRVLHAEHASYPEAVRLIAEGRVTIDGRRVRIMPPTPPAPLP